VAGTLNEEDVAKAVLAWSRERYPDSAVERMSGPYVDITVTKVKGILNLDPNATMTFAAKVECKGTQKDGATAIGIMYGALGQALWYQAQDVEGRLVPTFLAVPGDFYGLDKLKLILKQLRLPIGLLVVSEDGQVSIAKDSDTIPPTIPIKDLAK
jgi:hypothetical protein